MKIAFVDDYQLAIVNGKEVIPVGDDIAIPGTSPQTRLRYVIEHFEDLRPSFERLDPGKALPADTVRFRAPVPRPTQILCAIRNYLDDRPRDPEVDLFLKSALSVIGDGDVVQLPPVAARVFQHEPELGVVVGRSGVGITDSEAMDHVFGYTCFIDVSARDIGQSYYRRKSYRTFGVMGPVIVTADEIGDPYRLRVRLAVNGQERQSFTASLMATHIDRLLSIASNISGLDVGDVVATGTYHLGMGPLQNGDEVEMDIEDIGSLHVSVQDPLNRKWDENGAQLVPGRN